VVVLSLIALAVGFSPNYHRDAITPAGRVYVGTTFYTPDYSGYVSTIEQGRQGRWTHVDKFTSERLPATRLYLPYLLLGHIASWLGLSAVFMYHLSRLVFGVAFLGVVYWLIAATLTPGALPALPAAALPVARLGAFAFALGCAAWPVLGDGGLVLPGLSQGVAELQLSKRVLQQPHFILGNIAFVLGLVLLLKYLRTGGVTWVVLSGIVVLLTSFFRPSHTLALVVAALVLAAMQLADVLLRPGPRTALGRTLLFAAVNALGLAVAAVYLRHLRTQFPYLPYFLYDVTPQPGQVTVVGWLLAQGPVLMLALAGVLRAWRDEGTRLLLAVLLTSVLMALVVPEVVAFNPIRAMQLPLFAILAILAVAALAGELRPRALAAAMLVFLVMSLPMAALEVRSALHEYQGALGAYNIWPPPGYLDGLRALGEVSRPTDVVLAEFSLSNLAPTFSGNTVYWGHPNETLDYERKRREVERFYRRQMSEAEAQEFLRVNDIRYVLIGIEEKSLGGGRYGFLQRVFGNDVLEVYTR
jgi:hypothetical protein